MQISNYSKNIGNKKVYCRQIKVIWTFFIMNVIKMEVNTEKVFFFICEINSNVSYYRNANYASLFHVVVNDIKSHKNYYCLGHTFCFPAYSSQKVQNQNHERSSTLINHSALETMKSSSTRKQNWLYICRSIPGGNKESVLCLLTWGFLRSCFNKSWCKRLDISSSQAECLHHCLFRARSVVFDNDW